MEKGSLMLDYIELLQLAIVEPDDGLCIGRNMLFW